MDTKNIEEFIRNQFAKNVDIEKDELTQQNPSMQEIISRSEKLINSVDLMEAFAKTSNALHKEAGVRVRLPVLALDTPINDVLAIFMDEVKKQMELEHEKQS